MPRPNSSGPRRNKSGGKPQGARSGDRTRESRSDASGPKRSPKKSSRPRSEAKRGDRSSGFGGRPKRAPRDENDASKRPWQKGGFGKRSLRADGDEQDSGKPRSFGRAKSDASKRPFEKRSRGEGAARSFGKPKFGGSKRSYDKDKSFDKPSGAEGGDREFPSKKFDRSKFADEPRGAKGKSFGKTDNDHQGDSGRPFKKFDRSSVKRGGQAIRQEPEVPALRSSGPVRLNKFIANSGVCSRREADELITMGLISVNGKVVTTLGHKVNPGDEVRHENRVLRAEKPVYILMNKPKGFLTTTSDPEERSTVMNLVGNVIKERIYPVGRLDRNTTGLLVLTNDGDLAEKLMHPSHNVKKIYRVELDRPLTRTDATKIMDGVQLEEGRAVVDDLAYVSEDKKTVGLEIHIGWNRVVRRIFESLEYQVVKLDRTMYAGLTKKDLPRGEWRFLTREEIVLLKHFK